MPEVRVRLISRLCLILALSATALRAHDDHSHKPKKIAPDALYRPTAMPDRIILTWVGDPSTSQAVTWRTSIEVKHAWAEIALADAGPGFVKTARKVPATTQYLKSNLSEAHYHSAKFEGLRPASRYAYRVGDGANFSEWFQFSTASDRPEPFSFIYFGDAQNELRSMWSRVIREAYRDAPKARFMIHAGDLINSAESDADWGEWFSAGHWLNAMLPSVPVPGNHEMTSVKEKDAQGKEKDAQRRVSRHWRPQFALPENGPPGLEETCFTLVYQDVRLIGLNSNDQIAQQAQWLEHVLADNRCRWVVCAFHHPIFSTSAQRDNKALRMAWKPVFDKYKVDLVLQGHDHSYGRTGLNTPVTASENVGTGVNQLDAGTGTVYVVSVSGPKMYNLKSQSVMKRSGENTQLYQIIHIDGDTLRYEARTAVGDVYDGFTLRKRPGEVNELIEQVPPTPERRKPPEPPPAPAKPMTDSRATGK